MVAILLTSLFSPMAAIAASATLTVEAGSAQTITLGDALTLDGEAYAQGLDASSTGLTEATIDWGDSTTEDVISAVTMDAGGSYINGAHTYASAGDFTVTACAGDVGDGTTVCDSFVVTVEAPDFTISNLVFTEEVTTPGFYWVTMDLANVGLVSVDSSVGGVNLAEVNGGEQTGGYNWSTMDTAYLDFLDAGGETLATLAFGGPVELVDGDTVEVCVDSLDVVVESDEANNCVSTTFDDGVAALPDFIVSDVYAWEFATSTYVQVEDIPTGSDPSAYVLYFDITNQGGDATVPDTSAVYNDLCDSDCDTDTSALVQHTFGFFGDTDLLTAGGTSTDNAEEIYAGSPDTSDVLTFDYCVDTTSSVVESAETNNCSTFANPFYVAPVSETLLPDLVIDSVTLNADNTLHFVVSNQGTADLTSADVVTLSLYDQTTGTGAFPGDEYFTLSDYGTSYEAVGGSIEFDSTYVLPTLPTEILAVVDPANDIEELTETTFEANYYRVTFEATTMTVEAGADQTITVGATLTLDDEAYLENLSGADTPTATIDWGDTSSEAASLLISNPIYIQGSHTFGTVGSYTVTVCGTDSDSGVVLGTVCDTFTLTVAADESSSSGSSSSGGGTHHGGSSSSSNNNDEEVVLTGEDEVVSEEVVLTEEEIEACGEMSFVDVTEDSDGYDAIYQLWCEGVINGRDAEHFSPDDEVKRDEATKIVGRLFGYVTEAHDSIPEVTESSYSDMNTDEVLGYYVETMTDEGFFAEEEVIGEFRPHEDMTYSEIVDFLSEVSGEEVSVEGYEATDTMSRGNFVDLVLGFFQ